MLNCGCQSPLKCFGRGWRNCCLSAGCAATELAGISLSSHLSLPFAEFLGVLSPFFGGSKSDWEEKVHKKSAGWAKHTDKRNAHLSCSEQLLQKLVARQSSHFLSPHLGLSDAAAAFGLLLPVAPTHCESLRAAAGREVALVRRAGGGWGFWV